MKILHIGKFYPPFNGGMEVYLHDLAEQQTKKHNVTVIAHNHNFRFLTSPTQVETRNSVNIIRQKTIKPILFTPIMLGLNKRVKNLIQQDKVDIIHISWPNPSALFLLLNKTAKSKPWVIQWQSDMVTEKSSWLLKVAYKFFRPFEKKLLKQAHTIIASTQEYFNHSIALKPYQGKCEFIPLGITKLDADVNNQSIKWAKEQWKDAQYKIYSIGRLTFYKNHQLLIKAANLLPQAKFIITGTGNLQSKLEALIKQNKLNNIVLTGTLSKPKLNALMSTCDAFCLASNDRAESYGMVLLEALSFNKSILVSNLPGSGMKWIASQTPLGQTFDCNDANDLVNKIQNLYKNSPYTALNKCFTIESCTNSIDGIYNKLKVTTCIY